MATYDELSTLYSTGVLRNKVAVAVASAAEAILTEDVNTVNHAERYAWAARALKTPFGEADKFLMGVLVANKGLATSTIESATDLQVQNNVDSLIDVFALANI